MRGWGGRPGGRLIAARHARSGGMLHASPTHLCQVLLDARITAGRRISKGGQHGLLGVATWRCRQPRAAHRFENFRMAAGVQARPCSRLTKSMLALSAGSLARACVVLISSSGSLLSKGGTALVLERRRRASPPSLQYVCAPCASEKQSKVALRETAKPTG